MFSQAMISKVTATHNVSKIDTGYKMAKSTDLDKKSSHPLRCVVISGVTVDHANGINESWYTIDHANLKIQNTRMVKCETATKKLQKASKVLPRHHRVSL